ncbi:MAG: DEAD/DEAH box helicase family protein, partial [Candidatus Latescibacteria bacterium]|nr:DEAD/DEAH box helicase family protein [Candidatus Latescibacterota bacterium]
MTQSPDPISLSFDRGTILISGQKAAVSALDLPGSVFDARVGLHRSPARYYRHIVTKLRDLTVPYEDGARAYETLNLKLQIGRDPFPFQQEALEAWWSAGGQGVVVLPTGSGKTFVAQLTMMKAQRSTLVVVPTIDLMQQWHGVLSSQFDMEVGLIGGGYHEPMDVTVATYDSAYLHMERLGNRFGLIIFDECHHLPGPSYI